VEDDEIQRGDGGMKNSRSKKNLVKKTIIRPKKKKQGQKDHSYCRVLCWRELGADG
jgi:hypothetical protein